jgi:hypothetical protein
MADPLAAVLTEPIVASLATPRSYERGVLYFEEDRVGGLRVLAGRVRASVEGAETYAVELAAEDGGLLRRPAADAPAIARHPSLRASGRSELVRILLWETDLDAAWQAACDGGCTPALWLQLADQRRARHPQDALTVYRRHVEDLIAHKDKRSYAEAVALVDTTIRALYTECDRASDFAAYIDELRAAHKPKRNLMKLINELQLAQTSSTP